MLGFCVPPTETGPRFKVSSENLEKPGIERTTPGLALPLHHGCSEREYEQLVGRETMNKDFLALCIDFYGMVRNRHRVLKALW